MMNSTSSRVQVKKSVPNEKTAPRKGTKLPMKAKNSVTTEERSSPDTDTAIANRKKYNLRYPGSKVPIRIEPKTGGHSKSPSYLPMNENSGKNKVIPKGNTQFNSKDSLDEYKTNAPSPEKKIGCLKTNPPSPEKKFGYLKSSSHTQSNVTRKFTTYFNKEDKGPKKCPAKETVSSKSPLDNKSILKGVSMNDLKWNINSSPVRKDENSIKKRMCESAALTKNRKVRFKTLSSDNLNINIDKNKLPERLQRGGRINVPISDNFERQKRVRNEFMPTYNRNTGVGGKKSLQMADVNFRETMYPVSKKISQETFSLSSEDSIETLLKYEKSKLLADERNSNILVNDQSEKFETQFQFDTMQSSKFEGPPDTPRPEDSINSTKYKGQFIFPNTEEGKNFLKRPNDQISPKREDSKISPKSQVHRMSSKAEEAKTSPKCQGDSVYSNIEVVKTCPGSLGDGISTKTDNFKTLLEIENCKLMQWRRKAFESQGNIKRLNSFSEENDYKTSQNDENISEKQIEENFENMFSKSANAFDNYSSKEVPCVFSKQNSDTVKNILSKTSQHIKYNEETTSLNSETPIQNETKINFFKTRNPFDNYSSKEIPCVLSKQNPDAIKNILNKTSENIKYTEETTSLNSGTPIQNNIKSIFFESGTSFDNCSSKEKPCVLSNQNSDTIKNILNETTQDVKDTEETTSLNSETPIKNKSKIHVLSRRESIAKEVDQKIKILTSENLQKIKQDRKNALHFFTKKTRRSSSENPNNLTPRSEKPSNSKGLNNERVYGKSLNVMDYSLNELPTHDNKIEGIWGNSSRKMHHSNEERASLSPKYAYSADALVSPRNSKIPLPLHFINDSAHFLSNLRHSQPVDTKSETFQETIEDPKTIKSTDQVECDEDTLNNLKKKEKIFNPEYTIKGNTLWEKHKASNNVDEINDTENESVVNGNNSVKDSHQNISVLNNDQLNNCKLETFNFSKAKKNNAFNNKIYESYNKNENNYSSTVLGTDNSTEWETEGISCRKNCKEGQTKTEQCNKQVNLRNSENEDYCNKEAEHDENIHILKRQNGATNIESPDTKYTFFMKLSGLLSLLLLCAIFFQIDSLNSMINR